MIDFRYTIAYSADNGDDIETPRESDMMILDIVVDG